MAGTSPATTKRMGHKLRGQVLFGVCFSFATVTSLLLNCAFGLPGINRDILALKRAVQDGFAAASVIFAGANLVLSLQYTPEPRNRVHWGSVQISCRWRLILRSMLTTSLSATKTIFGSKTSFDAL